MRLRHQWCSAIRPQEAQLGRVSSPRNLLQKDFHSPSGAASLDMHPRHLGTQFVESKPGLLPALSSLGSAQFHKADVDRLNEPRQSCHLPPETGIKSLALKVNKDTKEQTYQQSPLILFLIDDALLKLDETVWEKGRIKREDSYRTNTSKVLKAARTFAR